MYLTMLIVVVFYAGCEKNTNTPLDSDRRIEVAQALRDESLPELLERPNHLPFLFEITNYDVEVVSVIIDENDRKVDFHMGIYSSADTLDAVFSVDFINNKSIFGQKVSLSENNGDLLWEYTMLIDTLNVNHTWLIENTIDDTIMVEKIITDTSRLEIYTHESLCESFYFQVNDFDTILALHELMLNKGGSLELSIYSGLNYQILSTLVEFHAFYPNINILDGNNYGYIAKEIFVNEAFAEWFYINYVDTTQYKLKPQWTKKEQWAEKLCEAADLCVIIKCPEGANPACEVCLAAAITCKVMDLFDLW